MTIFRIARSSRRAGTPARSGSTTDVGMMDGRVALARREIVEHFAPLRGGVFNGFDDWHGADVALRDRLADRLSRCAMLARLQAQGLPRAGPRAGVLRHLGGAHAGPRRRTGMGCPAIAPARGCATAACAAATERAGAGVRATASTSTSTAPPAARATRRRSLFYARPATPRRATELGMLALEELIARRPDTRVIVFGDTQAAATRRSPTSSRECCSRTSSRAPLRPRDRRAGALAHQLLAHAEGDDGLRPARGGRARRQRGVRVRA